MQMSQSLKAGLALFVSHCLFLSLSAPSSLRLSLPLPLSLFLCRSAYIFMWEEIVYLRTAASSVLSMFLTRMHAHRHTHTHTHTYTHIQTHTYTQSLGQGKRGIYQNNTLWPVFESAFCVERKIKGLFKIHPISFVLSANNHTLLVAYLCLSLCLCVCAAVRVHVRMCVHVFTHRLQ